MEAYTSFARVYDLFMDNVPYDEWCGQLLQIFREHGIEGGIVADLGCGTGNLTERLAAKGYDMIGIDNSGDMLELAPSLRVSRRACRHNSWKRARRERMPWSRGRVALAS